MDIGPTPLSGWRKSPPDQFTRMRRDLDGIEGLCFQNEVVEQFTVVGLHSVIILATPTRDVATLLKGYVPADFRVVLLDIDGRELAFITPPWAMFAGWETRGTPAALQWCKATADLAVEHLKRGEPILRRWATES